MLNETIRGVEDEKISTILYLEANWSLCTTHTVESSLFVGNQCSRVFWGILFTTNVDKKVTNRLTLVCNKPLTHISMNRHYLDILIIHEHSPPRIKAISGANFNINSTYAIYFLSRVKRHIFSPTRDDSKYEKIYLRNLSIKIRMNWICIWYRTAV